MTIPKITVGDLAQSHLLRNNQGRMKAELDRLVNDLSTGRRSQAHPKLGGDISPLSALQRSRNAIAPWQGAVSEAATAASAAQDVLARLAAGSQDLATSAIQTANTGTDADVARFATHARGEFAAMVNTLNTTVAGRSLFAGTASDQPALVPGASILADLSVATAGGVTADDHIAAIDAYFAPGGGFEGAAYLGGPRNPDQRIGPSEAVTGLPTATDQALRDVLKAMSIAALAGDPGLGLTASTQRALVDTAGERLLSANTGLVSMQAALGRDEERIESGRVRLNSEAVALDQAIADLTMVDPFETAARLEVMQVQLETLYAVTARLSTLGLAGYLR